MYNNKIEIMGLSIYALKLGKKISKEEYDYDGHGYDVFQADGMHPINHIPSIEEGYYEADILCSNCDIFYSKYSVFRNIISRVINHQFLIAINKRKEKESRKRKTKKQPYKAKMIKYIIKQS